MKRLITTADDFGLNSAVNAAVIDACRNGILRFASLMVDHPGAEEAVRLAKETPQLGVGLHLVMCEDHPEAWGARYFFVPRHRRAIEPKIRAQIEKFLSFGLKPTHVDGHINLHVHPAIFPVLARLAKEYGIPRMRLPSGEFSAGAGFARGHERGGAVVEGAVLGVLGRALRRKAQSVYVTPRTYGLLRSGLMHEDYVCHLLERLPDGVTEIYFHPTSDPASAVTDAPTSGHHTITELRTLTSPRVRKALEDNGIRLVQPGEPLSAG